MLHMVAKLHYEADLPQVQIAKQLGLSTATISRMLQRARAEGIVRIEVRDMVAPDVLGETLARKLGLRRVAVVEAPSGSTPVTLAAPLATILRAEELGPGSVIALGWGRTIRAMLEAGLPPLPGVLVVPATGGMQQEAAHFQINEFVRVAAMQMAGAPYFIHAPYLPSAAARDSFLADPAIRQAVDLWGRIDAAIVGIGLPHALTPPEASIATLPEQRLVNVAGDVIRHYFDSEGRLIDWDGEERMIAVSCAQLRQARLCVGLAVGANKAGSILAAARGELVNALVTDVPTAEAILDLL